MEPELEIKPFTFADIKLFFAKAMENFWNENNLNPPLYPLFPLNETVLETIYKKTNGNQRETIKLARMFVDKIVYNEMTLDELATDEDLQATVTAERAAAKQGISLGKAEEAGEAEEAVPAGKSEVATRIEEILEQEEYIVEVNPASVAGASLKCIKVYADKIGAQPTVNLEWKFTLEKKSGTKVYTLAGMVEHEGRMIGVEVPSIKNFGRSGGVAAFYAAQRLGDAIEQAILTDAILLVPMNTGGAKYLSILKKYAGKLHVVELDEDSAEALIRSAMKEPSIKGWEISRHVFDEAIDGLKPEEGAAPAATPAAPKPVAEEEEAVPEEKAASAEEEALPAPAEEEEEVPPTAKPVPKEVLGVKPAAVSKPAPPKPAVKPQTAAKPAEEKKSGLVLKPKSGLTFKKKEEKDE
jgi:hypothetical protein